MGGGKELLQGKCPVIREVREKNGCEIGKRQIKRGEKFTIRKAARSRKGKEKIWRKRKKKENLVTYLRKR